MGDKAYFDSARFDYTRFDVYNTVFDDGKKALKNAKNPSFEDLKAAFKK